MSLSRALIAATIMLWSQPSALAQERDISRPMQTLQANVVALVLTRLNANGVDQRLAFEIQLETPHPVPSSLADIKTMPADLQEAILEVCSNLMMPMVQSANEVGGFPDVSGVRITLRSKPTAAGTGTYQTLIFPQERGCQFGW
ncbi:hypothetical protein [Aureimonas pseudogalii]|uniref:Uncharacterized protein n=1 Tax=Aureimonas pseudogalii TaxID=1744844 RepID=A0A7W6H7I9_9HYPH|nr:hypothetical protein [Aureimonas pseudogalii]MBB4000011.1 hypothetical protein [Aureimonas pseudogalii]